MTRSNVANSLLQNGNPILTAVYVGLGFGPCASSSQGCEDQFVAGVLFKGETFLCQNPVPHRNEPTQTVHGVSGAIWRGMLNHFQGDGSEWFFVVHIRTHNVRSSLDPSNSYSCLSLVKFRLDFFVCGLQGHLSWHLAKSGPCFHATKATKAMNNCRDSASGQGWRRGCQPFSCRCSLNVMHCRKEIYGTCLSKESMPFVKSKPPLPTVPEAWGPWEPQHPVICREAEGLITELWSPRFVTIQWLCCQLCYETAANQRTSVEIELLATVSWTCGCQPFSCRKEICSTCLFQTSIPAVLFWNAKHYSLPYCKWSMYSLSSTAKSCCFEDLTKWRSCILS